MPLKRARAISAFDTWSNQSHPFPLGSPNQCISRCRPFVQCLDVTLASHHTYVNTPETPRVPKEIFDFLPSDARSEALQPQLPSRGSFDPRSRPWLRVGNA